MRRLSALFILGTALLAACDTSRTAPAHDAVPADLVFIGGAVYTMDAERSWAQAVAVDAGKIAAVGTNAEIEAWIGPDTGIVELSGAMLLPGFHDSHTHPLDGGRQALNCSFVDLDSVEAILDKVRSCALESEETGGWLVGSLWNISLFPGGNPHKELLDAVVPDRPVFLIGSDGHSSWANSRALEVAGIDRGTPDPPLGVIERDASTGEPTGTLRESAGELVRRHLPEITAQDRLEGLRYGVRMANAFGITSVLDAAVGEPDMITYKALEDSGELSVRSVLAMEWGTNFLAGGTDFERVLANRTQYDGPRIDTRAIKLFIDGVLEGHTAALLDPYLDSAGARGTLNFPQETLDQLVTRFDAEGLQVHMHAIGDAAVRAGLDAFEAARDANGPRDNRHHISHLQLIHPDDVPRFAELGVGATFQPLWAIPDAFIMDINLPEVGPERVNRMYPIGSVQRAGGLIIGGSDWDVSSMNPLLAIQVALTRSDPSGVAQGVLNAAERVDLDTMLAAYTINGAYTMRHDALTGSIEIGKAADLVVLEHNLFEIPADEIGDVRVLRTLIDGNTVYQRDSLQ